MVVVTSTVEVVASGVEVATSLTVVVVVQAVSAKEVAEGASVSGRTTTVVVVASAISVVSTRVVDVVVGVKETSRSVVIGKALALTRKEATPRRTIFF